jgi:uncharacterized membrane-anchored protein
MHSLLEAIHMLFKGNIAKDKRTKDLAKRIKPGEIAIIDHKDLDEIAANSLVNSKIKAIINQSPSISGKYPNKGPSILLDNGIFIIDVDFDLMDRLDEGDLIEIDEYGNIFKDEEKICNGLIIDKEKVESLIKFAYENISEELEKFIDNTIEYAKKEKGMILGDVVIPPLKTKFNNKHVLIVVRGQNYKEDLSTIRSYIDEVSPILVGVDGGADALLEFGLIPDLVVGDMDSISDECLKKSKEIVVHAYPDGRAPGLSRIEELGLESVVLPSPGTSEDIAMLIAYENNAELIVAVGTHSNIIDFLEKGRKGMSSTFLVRLKIGYKLIDAKGVSLLYKGSLKLKYVWWLFIAAMFPILILIYLSQPMQQIIKLLEIQLKILLNF